MFDSITKCLQSTRFPVVCLVLIMVMNGLAAWSVPPLAPVLIGFNKESIQVREGDTHNLSVELDPLPTADVQVVLEWDGPEHGTCWQFGQHRDLAIADDGRWVLRIPEGRRTLTLPIRFIDDEIKKTQPDVLKINLLHLTENTKPGGFNEARIEIKDAYIAPVIEIAPDAALQVREGNVLTLPVIAQGEVDLPISVPFALRDSAKDIKVEPANRISFRQGSNDGTIDLKAVKDRLYEGEEKFFLRLEEGERYVLGDRREIEFTVIDGDSPPVYQIDATQSVFGHDEPVNVKLRANIPSAEDKRVDYELVPSPALPNDILPPDKRIGHFLVRAGEEKDMQVVLDSSANWPQGNHLIKVRIQSDRVNRKGHEVASFTITHTPAGLTPTEALLEEGKDDQTVIVRLPEGTQAARAIDLRLRFSGNALLGSDYAIVGGLASAIEETGDRVWECPLRIPEGQSQTSFQVRPLDDVAYEGEETERVEIEIVEASAGIDQIGNVAVLSLEDNEKKPTLALRWVGEKTPIKNLIEGTEGQIDIRISENAQVEVPVEGILEITGEAREGLEYQIDAKQFSIPVGKKHIRVGLRAIDDLRPNRNNPPRKDLSIVFEENSLKNAVAAGDRLTAYITDNDKWEGEKEVLILVAMTEAWGNDDIRETIESALEDFKGQGGHALIGGGVQWFDAQANNEQSLLPRDWPPERGAEIKLFKQRDTNGVLGSAQEIEKWVKAQRMGRPFTVLLFYPLIERKNQTVGDEKFIPKKGQTRELFVVGREKGSIEAPLLTDFKGYGSVMAPDENPKVLKSQIRKRLK